MTDEEIRRSYKYAKKKKMQIQILSELTLKPRDEIMRIIFGADIGRAPKKRITIRKGLWREDEIAYLIEATKKGVVKKEIALTLGRSYSSVASKIHEMRIEGELR